MEFSEHNIISRIRDSENFFIVNLLSKNADIIEPDLEERVRRGTLTSGEEKEFSEKGYLVDPEQERKRYRQAYVDFMEARDKEEVQLFFVPTYGCNFSCEYCYQGDYTSPSGELTRDVVDAFFRFIDSEFSQ